ncbi:MAG: hypothetical protein AAB673_01120 [Patescibacteria group bacterium]
MFLRNLNHHLHLRFFKNKEVDSLYFTSALVNFAGGLNGVFVPIYFWQMGLPFWQILFYYFLMSLYFIVAAFLFLPILRRLSDKMMMFLGVPFIVLYYVGLGLVGGTPVLFYLLPAAAAIGSLLFNLGYHIDFNCVADGDCLGREVGMRQTIDYLVRFSAPALGGFLISFFGFQNSFFVSVGIFFVAIIPLFFFPKRKMALNLTGRSVLGNLFDKKILPFNLSSIGYAMETNVGGIVWPFFVFLTMGDIRSFGGIISAGLLVGSVVNYLVGYFSDKGDSRKIFTWSTAVFSLIWFVRIFLTKAWMVAGAHLGADVVYSALLVPWARKYYRVARQMNDACSFILSQEILYHLARLIFLPGLMLLAYMLPGLAFFRVAFILGALVTLLFLFANKIHTGALNVSKV